MLFRRPTDCASYVVAGTTSNAHVGHFDMGTRKGRILFWNKSWAGALFRNRPREVSNSSFEEVSGGSTISNSTNPKGFEFCFGGSLRREPPVGLEQKRCRSLFLRKSWAGTPFRNRTRKISNSSFEEVLGGSAISKSDPKFSKSSEIVFWKKYQTKPSFRNGHTAVSYTHLTLPTICSV